jgi:hypothetical protein
MPDYWKQAAKIRKQKAEKGINKQEIEEYQTYWRVAGPIRFAEEHLTCPLDVPIHPDFNSNNNPDLPCNKYCSIGLHHPRFRPNGIPFHIVLSEEQKAFLTELWHGLTMALLAAARGAGKTFILGIYDGWKITVEDRISITCMGGSSEQSEIAQGYIDEWRMDTPMLNTIIYKSLKGIKKYCKTLGRSKCGFPACSPPSARGKHVNIVEIDEACVAEDKSEEGAKAVAAVQWQTTGKRMTQIILASTAHYIHGMFYEYMIHPEKYGFKVFRWGIVKHISGETDPMKVYTDKEPSHWLPAVWWITPKEVREKRLSKSDEEWLCEALGGASMASGAVLKKEDLDAVICGLCEECNPYHWDDDPEKRCKLIDLAILGDKEDPLKYVVDRQGGFDYGVSDAPCALTIVGRKSNVVFVLFNEEQMGLREEEKTDWVHTNMQEFGTWTLIPDPAVAGKHLNEKWSDMGYGIQTIPEADKMPRVYNAINHIESHKVIIPKAFWYLTQSLRKLAWDRDNKIRKVDDHSFDCFCYSIVGFRVEEESNILEEFLNANQGNSSQPSIDKMYGEGINI